MCFGEWVWRAPEGGMVFISILLIGYGQNLAVWMASLNVDTPALMESPAQNPKEAELLWLTKWNALLSGLTLCFSMYFIRLQFVYLEKKKGITIDLFNVVLVLN